MATTLSNVRISFKHVEALWEGPYDVLRFAYAASACSPKPMKPA